MKVVKLKEVISETVLNVTKCYWNPCCVSNGQGVVIYKI
jgi:hypothetical protein